MNIHLPVVLKWVLTAAFSGWSCILLMVIIGEESPNIPFSLFSFFLIKFIAIGAAYATLKAANWCYNRDLFPELINAYIEKCNNEAEEEDEEL